MDGETMNDVQGDGDAGSAPPLPGVGELIVVGLPGAFSQWGVSLIREMLAAAGSASAVVLLHQAPALGYPREQGSRCVVLLDEPDRALAELTAQGMEPMAATRHLTAWLAPLPGLLGEPGTFLVARAALADMAALRSGLAAHLLPHGPWPDGAMAAESAIDATAPGPQLSGQALALARQVLRPMAEHAAGRRGVPIVWPLTCFYAGDHLDEVAPPLVDVVGPARVLYYGPYFHLPAGNWRVDVQFFCSETLAGALLGVEIFSDRELARASVRPSHGGLFQASFPLVTQRPEERIEARIWLLAGVLDGQLGLRQVVFQPV
jgi:hypothetical protein